jgi:hypothetical protein
MADKLVQAYVLAPAICCGEPYLVALGFKMGVCGQCRQQPHAISQPMHYLADVTASTEPYMRLAGSESHAKRVTQQFGIPV